MHIVRLSAASGTYGLYVADRRFPPTNTPLAFKGTFEECQEARELWQERGTDW